MSKKISNTDLQTQIDKLHRKFNKEFSAMRRYVDDKITPISNYITEQKGYERGLKDSKVNGKVTFTFEQLMQLIKALLIIGALLASGTVAANYAGLLK